MDPICYLDMDGVLTNFVEGAIDSHGLSGRVEWWEADWGFTFLRKFGKPSYDDNQEHFWRGMDRSYWRNLNWMPDGREFLKGIESIFGRHNVTILSDPGPNDGGVDGKKDWLRIHAPDYLSTAFFGRAKHMLAAPGKVLVDDYDKNVTNFNLYGGSGVLLPRPWNDRAPETTNGLFDVGEMLNQLSSRRAILAKGK